MTSTWRAATTRAASKPKRRCRSAAVGCVPACGWFCGRDLLPSLPPFVLAGEAEALRPVPSGAVLLQGVPARGLARGTLEGVRTGARARRSRPSRHSSPLCVARASGREDRRRRARGPASCRCCRVAARDGHCRLRAVRHERRATLGVRALPVRQVLLAGVPESGLVPPQAGLRGAGGAARGAELGGVGWGGRQGSRYLSSYVS
jgi:hypothetical protein